MSNLIDIQSQIEKLQKQAAQIKEKEFDTTVQEILAKMAAFGITVKDLQTSKPRGRKKVTVGEKSKSKRKSKLAGSSVAPKFRGPNGETWSGRGLMPKWLSVLIASGKPKEEFAV